MSESMSEGLRTEEQIKQEYATLCMALGDTSANIYILEQKKQTICIRIEQLQKEMEKLLEKTIVERKKQDESSQSNGDEVGERSESGTH